MQVIVVVRNTESVLFSGEYNVTIDDIQNAVSSENQTISGGEVLVDGMRKTIRIEGEVVEEIVMAEGS